MALLAQKTLFFPKISRFVEGVALAHLFTGSAFARIKHVKILLINSVFI
jgi:hypothetical protein